MNLNLVNWHRYVYIILGGILAVCLAIQAGAIALPPNLIGAQFYVAIAVVFLTFILPEFGATTPKDPPKDPPTDPSPPVRLVNPNMTSGGVTIPTPTFPVSADPNAPRPPSGAA